MEKTYTHLPGSRQRLKCLHGAKSFLFIFLLTMPPTFMGSCRKITAAAPESEDPVPEVQVRDSVLTTVRLQTGGEPLRQLDLFIYDAEGTKNLQTYMHCDSPSETVCLNALPGDKILVGIANSPRRFNLNALARFDAMEQLQFQFPDDSPDFPILGGFCQTGADRGDIRLRPLLCKVVLTTVSNTMDGYELVEEPRVRLTNLPAAAEILRDSGFRPNELLDAGAWQALPCDVGYFPQKPGIELWCYPNDTPENILGTPRPCLELECVILGKTCSFECPLPPMERGSTKEVELVINGPYDYRYNVR